MPIFHNDEPMYSSDCPVPEITSDEVEKIKDDIKRNINPRTKKSPYDKFSSYAKGIDRALLSSYEVINKKKG